MYVMERVEAVETLVEIQAYGQSQADLLGIHDEDIPALVEAALANPDPRAIAEARLICASRPLPRLAPRPSSVAREISDVEHIVREVSTTLVG